MWITSEKQNTNKFENTNKNTHLCYMTTQTINLNVIGLVYDNGTTEILVVTPRQWKAKLRNKKYKQSIINKSQLTSIHIKIKTK